MGPLTRAAAAAINVYVLSAERTNECPDDDEVTQGDRTTYEGHATAMLWTETTQLGCAVASCQKSGWSYEFLTCNYNPP